MEALAELLAALPALATALALLLAWLLLRRRPAASSDPDRAAPEPAPPTAVRATSAPPGPAATEDAAAPQEPGEPAEPAEEQAAEEKQEEEQEQDSEEEPPPAEPEEDDGGEAFFKYSPGKLRGSQYKRMMTKEELEEEQRVQKEQLAAIFKLMEDNKETFGEMSHGDVQEQLRLYDIRTSGSFCNYGSKQVGEHSLSKKASSAPPSILEQSNGLRVKPPPAFPSRSMRLT
ncbi:matrix-remodeling-associated protein 7 [Eptesicus fuscus]|uniref:matrix-remodeling-associated protein 7 n=1 Tax=Eptesicus fuscus TaxID=29078 RepID=UPI0024043E4E|nr:matrix-remodeling-associated protein 7 [Eptesicus fuscus]